VGDLSTGVLILIFASAAASDDLGIAAVMTAVFSPRSS
jgi:hypothetical protein